MSAHETTPDRDENLTDSGSSGLSDVDSVSRDRSYSPASETETEQKQDEVLSENVDSDIDSDQVEVAPGTGGPDDVGEIEVDPGDLNLPWRP